MRITINGKRYRFVIKRLVRCKGMCNAQRKTIYIDSRIKKAFLRVLIHEILHAADWSKNEKWVHRTSKSIAKIINRLFKIEARKPRAKSQEPGSQEARKPGSQEARKPGSQEARKPGSQEARKPGI